METNMVQESIMAYDPNQQSEIASDNSLGFEETSLGVDLQTLYSRVDMISQNIQALEPICQRIHLLQQNELGSNHTEFQISEQFNQLLSTQNRLEMEIFSIANEYDGLQSIVLNELKKWQHNQALAGNGAPFDDNLDTIQVYIETLVRITCNILNDLTILMRLELRDTAKLTELQQHMSTAQTLLLFSAFIVERQPPQVLKKNSHFNCTVRWLIGPQLDIALNHPTIKCILLSESQARRQCIQQPRIHVGNEPPPHVGTLTNNTSTLEYLQLSRRFTANFEKMFLTDFKRAEKKGTDSVMDTKFAILFYTSTIVNQHQISVWTLSLPIVPTVHTNQETQALATIMWDNAFAEIGREPFQVPDRVSWAQISHALNMKFTSETGRGLTNDNYDYIYEKLFQPDMTGNRKDFITWSEFCKQPMPNCTFTFWNWFFRVLKITKDHLANLWRANLIVGFISKRKTTETILKTNIAGSFLLRFSDSELGGISVAFVNEKLQVLHLTPWKANDLIIRKLADRVNDLTHLLYVLPLNMPKYEAFKDYIVEYTGYKEGYVSSEIRIVMKNDVPRSSLENQWQSQNSLHELQEANRLCEIEDNELESYLTGMETESIVREISERSLESIFANS